jgi:hypothetical protein
MSMVQNLVLNRQQQCELVEASDSQDQDLVQQPVVAGACMSLLLLLLLLLL